MLFRSLHPDGRITYPVISAGIADLLGYTAEEVMRDPNLLANAILPEDRAQLLQAIRRSAEDLSSFEIEMRNVTATGEVKWVRSSAHTTRRPDGSIIWDGVVLDISDRRAAEARAEAASARLVGSVEALAEAVAIFDAEDRLVLCNARWREINALVEDLIVPGVAFETLLRAGLQLGRFPEAAGDHEGWLRRRLERHR